MKKYPSILITAVVATCVSSAFAQGTVVFNNGTGLVWQLMSPSDPNLTEVPKGGGSVQLFWAPAGTPYTPWMASLAPAAWYVANPGWSLGPVVGLNTPVAGRFNGGVLTLSPLAAGGTIDYVVIGWTGIAQSFDTALAGISQANVSSRFTSSTGNPTATPPGTAVLLANSFGGLILAMPEPSGITLGILGGATWLVLRRRK
jgi:hypothetical protein